ncbi:hypothetical protein M4D56_17810 [Cytobacillus oceanisediminis]|uniref:hypothetical protein n=1 Tax=Cytobacillus oceanisediminis TaxID=665099 RepID=UPI002041B32C|nr:hypothetical protein [Cytobacillus oceanisediminis]MCM3530942.1 hypothetical protein [Cytobacillus oceanisediminis]
MPEMLMDFAVEMDREGAFISFEKREQAWKTFYHKLKELKKGEASSLKEIANRVCCKRIGKCNTL